MSRANVLDRFRDVMFKAADETGLSANEQKQLIRYRDAFSQCLDNPMLRDVEMRDYLMTTYNISDSQAYRDLGNIRVLLGNVRNASKEWIRYMVIEGLKKQYEYADRLGKTKEAIMALDKLAKYNRLDKEDLDELPYDKVIPINWEATTDISVLGVKPMQNKEEEILRLYKKYIDDIEIEDIEYIETKK